MLLWPTLAENIATILLSLYGTPTELLRLAVHIGDLAATSDDPMQMQSPTLLAALRLVDAVSSSFKPKKESKKKVEPLSKEEAEIGIAQRFGTIMDRWSLRTDQEESGRNFAVDAGVRTRFLGWKQQHQQLWKAICTWDPELRRVHVGDRKRKRG